MTLTAVDQRTSSSFLPDSLHSVSTFSSTSLSSLHPTPWYLRRLRLHSLIKGMQSKNCPGAPASTFWWGEIAGYQSEPTNRMGSCTFYKAACRWCQLLGSNSTLGWTLLFCFFMISEIQCIYHTPYVCIKYYFIDLLCRDFQFFIFSSHFGIKFDWMNSWQRLAFFCPH